MRVLQEITTWDKAKAGFDVPNHIYYVDDKKEKIHAYYSAKRNKIITLAVPTKFDTRYRKFKELTSK